jgi:hypothetical protein
MDFGGKNQFSARNTGIIIRESLKLAGEISGVMGRWIDGRIRRGFEDETSVARALLVPVLPELDHQR